MCLPKDIFINYPTFLPPLAATNNKEQDTAFPFKLSLGHSSPIPRMLTLIDLGPKALIVFSNIYMQ